MKQTLYILIASFFITSCATILNGAHEKIRVYTTKPSKIVYNNEAVKTVNNKARLSVERKNEAAEIIVQTDSLEKKIKVEPKTSLTCWANIANWGLGMFIDCKNPRRYSYPRTIYINSSDTCGRYFRHGQADNKGELHFHISLPYVNSFYLMPENESAKKNTGFWGSSFGLDYYYAKNQFISLNLSLAFDLFVPVPAAVRILDTNERMDSEYISIINNYRVKRFVFGYGVSFVKNIWARSYYNNFSSQFPVIESVGKTSNALGMIFPVYLQVGHNFHIGIIYRPTFYRQNLVDAFKYEHLISLDLAWKIRIKQGCQERGFSL